MVYEIYIKNYNIKLTTVKKKMNKNTEKEKFIETR
jgi:hypothetical protein